MKNQTIFLIVLITLWSSPSTIFSCPACTHHDTAHPNIENIPPHLTLEEFCQIHGIDPESLKKHTHHATLTDDETDSEYDEDMDEQNYMGIGEIFTDEEDDEEEM